jgi:RHH-type transcriptional regulator, rel operon repressor / antitoxin RelB
MPTTIRLPEEAERRLDALAASTHRPKSFYLRELILNNLDDLEDYYRAVEVSARIKRGEEKVYTLEHVEAELGLDR